MEIDYIFLLDLVGVVAFAISGVLIAMDKRMDLFGVFIIASVTAIGGGTLRDLLIDEPVAWVHNMSYIYVIIGTTIFSIIFKNKLFYLRKSLPFFDTVGLAIFTLIGLEKALETGFSPIICIATGTMTACFGGIIRDILTNRIPLIFRKEIYATACIIGGIIYFLLHFFPIPDSIVFIVTFSVIFIIRLLAVRYNLQLPTPYPNK